MRAVDRVIEQRQQVRGVVMADPLLGLSLVDVKVTMKIGPHDLSEIYV